MNEWITLIQTKNYNIIKTNRTKVIVTKKEQVEVKLISTHFSLLLSHTLGLGLVMLCEVEVKSEQMSLFCRRCRVILLSWHWSGVHSTTEVPEQRRVVTSLSELLCSQQLQCQPANCSRAKCLHWGMWSDQWLEVDECSLNVCTTNI